MYHSLTHMRVYILSLDMCIYSSGQKNVSVPVLKLCQNNGILFRKYGVLQLSYSHGYSVSDFSAFALFPFSTMLLL